MTAFEVVEYLGHKIKVEESRLTIYQPDGDILACGRIEMSAARRLIKAQRRPAWMDDREVALDRAEMAREQRHEDWEAIDHALENGRMG